MAEPGKVAGVKRKAATSTSSKAGRSWTTLTPSLSEWLLEYISAVGFSRMTPVQANTIPLFIGNKDVVVEAVTGSGKTLSFLIPVVEKLLRLNEPIKRHHVGAIIISPTRELATQIYSVLTSLLAFHPPSAQHLNPPDPDAADDSDSDRSDAEPKTPAVVFPSSTLKVIPQLLLGGLTPPAQDLAQFLRNSPNLLVGTPGRLLELLSSPHVHCPQSSFEVLVLDEADRLLDMGFKADLQNILKRLPKQRRTGLFSASVSDAVDQLVRVGLRNPVKIAVKVRSANGADERKTPASLEMSYLTTAPTAKFPALIQLLRKLDPVPAKTIVYVSTCAAVDYFSQLLPSLLSLDSTPSPSSSPALPPRYRQPFTVVPLHGKQTPQHRAKNYNLFTSSSSPAILLTTDLASRGLDISGVDVTVQIDPPSDPKTFLHRAGRAGRAGRRGLAVVFLLPGRETEEYPLFLDVRQTPVTQLTQPSVDVQAADCAKHTAAMRQVVLTDRTLHDKGQRAFVSWVQSYAKHAASSIFRVAELPWHDLGAAWGLLRLPKMPELRKAALKPVASGADPRDLGVDLDWDAYAYKDAAKQKKHLAQRADRAGAGAVSNRAGQGARTAVERTSDDRSAHEGQSGRTSDSRDGDGAPTPTERAARKRAKRGAWSKKATAQEEIQARREKRSAKRSAVRRAHMSDTQLRDHAETERMLRRVRDMYRQEQGQEQGSANAADGPVRNTDWSGFD